MISELKRSASFRLANGYSAWVQFRQSKTGAPGLFLIAVLIAVVAGATSLRAAALPSLEIPMVEKSAPRNVTVDDIVRHRTIQVLEVSSDKLRYAINVRQRDPEANAYRTGWFVGLTEKPGVMPIGGGGEARLMVLPSGVATGDLMDPLCRWSPDSNWLAYAVKHGGQVQIWRSKADGSAQEQLTHNAADVGDFVWSEDGRQLLFQTGRPRAEIRAEEEFRSRRGWRYDEELSYFRELMEPLRREPPQHALFTWTLDLETGRETQGDAATLAEFKRIKARVEGGREQLSGFMTNAVVPPIEREGATAWIERVAPMSMYLRLAASIDGKTIQSKHPEATGMIAKIWWSDQRREVLFWRRDYDGDMNNVFLSWRPEDDTVTRLFEMRDHFVRSCAMVSGDRLLCAREGKAEPAHVVLVDLRAGELIKVADPNPEFRNIRLGRAERYTYRLPSLPWHEPGGALAGAFPPELVGYMLLPPDFDPAKKYPVFIEPYGLAGMFNDSVGHEHALQAYAAAGIVVLSQSFPRAIDPLVKFGGNSNELMRIFYSSELDYPQLTMRMEAMRAGLDAAIARGFIDPTRVGVGSISNGTFVPLYLAQKYDRLTAMSTSAGSWSPEEYYAPTRRGRTRAGKDWRPKPAGETKDFWSRIDIAEHVDEIEAPILMHHSLSEANIAQRFMRHLDEAGLPYDAYIFTNETHVKWQPAHIAAVMHRNHDWFRFWLQDYDPTTTGGGSIDQDRREQFAKWRQLRVLQAKNPRSLRDYSSYVE